MDLLTQQWHWFATPSNWRGATGIPTLVGQHVLMSLAATLIAMAVALPVGVVLGHLGKGGLLAINVTNVGRAIPSFALMIFFVLIFGLGTAPTLIALIVLAVPPVITNAYQGMRSVDRDLVDAARGLGMTEAQVLRRVELPIALPVIMAGVRTAGVQVVATATLGAYVAWGGLGLLIEQGLNTATGYSELLGGAILVALLAGVTEGLLALLQRLLTPAGLRKVGASRAAGAAESATSQGKAAA
ncbi:MAG: ABC transporter permease [Candidatus Dormibacteraeota bacterium]|nr:ABC transporter permease [Candidatus Dormibacteraeota bacterium]